MIESDWSLQNGGNLYYWNSHRKSLSRLAAFALPLKIAMSAGKKAGLLPQTVGKLEDRTGRWFAKFIATTNFVLFRDSSSRTNLTAATNKQTAMDTCPDLVYFLTSSGEHCKIEEIKAPEEFIAITLRDESLGDYGVADYEEDKAATRARILDLFPQALTEIKKQCPLPIVIVVQVKRDAEISELLRKDLLERGFDVSIVECYDPVSLINFYANAKILIAMRLHSQIFALNSGTPSVALWRERLGTKIPSMMSDLDCADYCLNFDKTTGEDLTKTIDKLIQNSDEVSKKCDRLLSERKQKTLDFLGAHFK